jgi:hypothetical protein
MLSPKATNRVTLIRGGAATVTLKVQVSLRFRASVAVQVTTVDPTGKLSEGAGVHCVATGAAPPTMVAGG